MYTRQLCSLLTFERTNARIGKRSSHLKYSLSALCGSPTHPLALRGKWTGRREMKCFRLEVRCCGAFAFISVDLSLMARLFLWHTCRSADNSSHLSRHQWISTRSNHSDGNVKHTWSVIWKYFFFLLLFFISPQITASSSNSRCSGYLWLNRCSNEQVNLIKRVDQDSLHSQSQARKREGAPD